MGPFLLLAGYGLSLASTEPLAVPGHVDDARVSSRAPAIDLPAIVAAVFVTLRIRLQIGFCRNHLAFGARNALHSDRHKEEVQLCAFDVPAMDGDNLWDQPLSVSKANLQ